MTIDGTRTVRKTGHTHPMARPEFDRGRVRANRRMARMVLVLEPSEEQKADLQGLLEAQQDPQSAEYQRWLTPEEYGQRFGVSTGDLERITTWLESNGFEVEPVPESRQNVIFSGTVGQVEQAFQTEMRTFVVDGEEHVANAMNPAIPEALAGVVSGISSLHNFGKRPLHSRKTPQFNAGGAHYIVPADFATIYGTAALTATGVDGRGVSIAIAGQSNISLDDVRAFRSTLGLPANDPKIVVNGTDPGLIAGDRDEATLDVEWAGGVAPAATVTLVVSASTRATSGVDLSAQYIVNKNLASIVSVSYGFCEQGLGDAENRFWNALWQQAASQGITALVASGDSGVAGCNGGGDSSANNPAGVNGVGTSPYSTTVGGTMFADAASPSQYWRSTNEAKTFGSALSYIPEAVWNESGSTAGGSGLWAGGGGWSVMWPQPAWQTGIVTAGGIRRAVPDVSFNAAGSHDGYIMLLSGKTMSVGGTSVSSPAFAGMLALVSQMNSTRLGNINPTLYALWSKQVAGGAKVFHDVTAGNNSVPGLTGFAAGAGFDLATGLGSVDGGQLAARWKDVKDPTPAPARSYSFDASTGSTASVRGGASVTVPVKLAYLNGFNAAVNLAVTGLPAGVTARFDPASLTAPASQSTLTLTAATNAAASTASLTLAAVSGSTTKTATVALTVTPGCVITIDPRSAQVAAGGGTGTIPVRTATGCAWTATTAASWLQIVSGRTGSGNGSIGYQVAANTATTARSAAISVSGVEFSVTQAQAPTFRLDRTAATAGFSGGDGSVGVTPTPSTATWSASSGASWITLTAGAGSNTGARSVGYRVALNTATQSRVGTLTIAGQTFTITQEAAPVTRLDSTQATYSAAGGTGAVTVTSATTTWTASSPANWITATKQGGVVRYTVALNTTSQRRTATLVIAGLPFSVTQEALAPFRLSASQVSMPAAGGSGQVTVTAPLANLSWTAASPASWVTFSTSGNVLRFNVAANSTRQARSATLQVAGVAFVVTQEGGR